MGHITHLGNQLASLAERQIIAEALAKSEKWSEWVDQTLSGLNRAEDTMQWGCGRPQRPSLASLQSSDELEDETLTFKV